MDSENVFLSTFREYQKPVILKNILFIYHSFETFLFQEDVGDPVFDKNLFLGIIADVGDDIKPAIMIRPGCSRTDYDFSAEVESSKRRKLCG